MSPTDFLNQIIRPTLAVLNLGGEAVENLLLGTAMQESRLQDVRQVHGPALGPFQMEPATHDDVWESYLKYHFPLAHKIRGLLPDGLAVESSLLLGHPQYACAMARVLYYRAPGAVPKDLKGQAAYYKLHYNTPMGAATEDQYINNFLAMGGGFPFKELD